MEKELLKRYLENKCSPDEAKEVEFWLADLDNESIVRDHMRAQWNELPHYSPTPDLTPVMANILSHVSAKNELPIPAKPKQSRHYLKFAAVILVLMVCISVIVISNRQRFDYEQTQLWLEEHGDDIHAGVPRKILLSDGTEVWLNAKSTLRYAKNFEGQQREVYLDGEAYFDVVEDPTRPFIVYTNDIFVTVLGTAFTVKSYQDDETSEAVLVRGTVVVAKQNLLTRETQQLEPNERAVFNRTSKEISVSNVTASDYTTWREGTLRFDSEPISNVVRALQRWYDVEIIFQKNPPTTCVLTARIHKETLEETLELLQFSTGVEYERTGDIIYLSGSMCDN
jgi:ferric-dicitrate binding protein FerR (iron transport regulator)